MFDDAVCSGVGKTSSYSRAECKLSDLSANAEKSPPAFGLTSSRLKMKVGARIAERFSTYSCCRAACVPGQHRRRARVTRCEIYESNVESRGTGGTPRNRERSRTAAFRLVGGLSAFRKAVVHGVRGPVHSAQIGGSNTTG